MRPRNRFRDLRAHDSIDAFPRQYTKPSVYFRNNRAYSTKLVSELRLQRGDALFQLRHVVSNRLENDVHDHDEQVEGERHVRQWLVLVCWHRLTSFPEKVAT